MVKKIFIIATLIVTNSFVLLAQKSRALSFLEFNPDVRTAGMGNAASGNVQSTFIYTDPTAFLSNKENFYSSYSYGMYSKINGQRQDFHTVSAGYKFLEKHVVMAGFRHFGGLEIPKFDSYGQPNGEIKPRDWTIDLTYAFKINRLFSFYIGGSVIESDFSSKDYTFSANAGFNFKNSIGNTDNISNYSLSLFVRDLGGEIKYSKFSDSYKLPTSVGVGGTIDYAISDNHKITAAANTRYFIQPSVSKELTAAFGLEYSFFNIASIRTGYQILDDNNHFTLGLGARYKYVGLDCAYSFAEDSNYNIARFGINLFF